MLANGAVWSSSNELLAVVLLPAASVETTLSATAPSGRPAAGIVPEAGATALVSMDQLPEASVVAVLGCAPPVDGVSVSVSLLCAAPVPVRIGLALAVCL